MTTTTANDFEYAWRGGDVHLHRAGCRDLSRPNQFGEKYYEITKVAGHYGVDHARDLAALDYLEAVDYGDGEFWGDIAAGIVAYRNAVEVYPCTAK